MMSSRLRPRGSHSHGADIARARLPGCSYSTRRVPRTRRHRRCTASRHFYSLRAAAVLATPTRPDASVTARSLPRDTNPRLRSATGPPGDRARRLWRACDARRAERAAAPRQLRLRKSAPAPASLAAQKVAVVGKSTHRRRAALRGAGERAAGPPGDRARRAWRACDARGAEWAAHPAGRGSESPPRLARRA